MLVQCIYSHLPCKAFFTFSILSTHCSMSASLGAAKKNDLLKVPKLNICCNSLYSSPTSKFIHSRISITLRGDLDESNAFFDLKHSNVLHARSTMKRSFHFYIHVRVCATEKERRHMRLQFMY